VRIARNADLRSVLGQSHRSDQLPLTSGLPR